MKTLPSISGACSGVRPSQRSSVSSLSPSTRRSISRPTHCGFGFGADLLLELHQLAAAGLDGALGDLELGGELEGGCAFFVGVGEDAEPVDLRGGDEGFELLVVLFGLAGEADDEAGADDDAGDDAARLLDELEEDLGVPPRFMRLSTLGLACCSGTSRYLAMLSWLRDGLEQPRGDLVGVGVEEAQPAEAGKHGEGVEQRGRGRL